MFTRILLFFAISLCAHAATAQALGWATQLQTPPGPLPAGVADSLVLEDGSSLVALNLEVFGSPALTGQPSRRLPMVVRVSVEGQLIWSADLGEQFGIGGSAVVQIVRLPDGDVVVLATGAIARLSGDTGAVQWHRPLAGSFSRMRIAGNDAAYVVGALVELVPPFADQWGVAERISLASGATQWRYVHRGPSSGFGSFWQFSEPQVLLNGDLLVASAQARLFRLSAESGEVVWVNADPAPSDRKLLITPDGNSIVDLGGSAGGLALRSTQNGEVVWELPAMGGLASQAPQSLHVVGDDVVTVSQPNSTGTLDPVDTVVRSTRLADGSMRWQINAMSAIEGPRYVRSVVQAANLGRLYLLFSPSNFAASPMNAAPQGRKILVLDQSTGAVLAGRDLSPETPLGLAEVLIHSVSGGVRAVAAGTGMDTLPGLHIGQLQPDTAATLALASVTAFEGAQEVARDVIHFSNGEMVVATEQGGASSIRPSLVRLSSDGSLLWRSDLSDPHFEGRQWVAVVRRTDDQILGVVRGRVPQDVSYAVGLNAHTGELLWTQALAPSTCALPLYTPTHATVHPSTSDILIAGSHPVECGRGVGVIALEGTEPLVKWESSIEGFNVTAQLSVVSSGAVVLLGNSGGGGNGRFDALVRLDSANGTFDWSHYYPAGNRRMTSFLIDDVAGQVRLVGGAMGSSYNIVEDQFSLATGELQTTRCVFCGLIGTSSEWQDLRSYWLGSRPVTVLTRPVSGSVLVHSRTNWAAEPTMLESDPIPFPYQFRDVVALSSGNIILLLNDLRSGAVQPLPSRIARIDLATGGFGSTTDLFLPNGAALHAERLVSLGANVGVAGSVPFRGRRRAAAATVADTMIFRSGFEASP
jgi:outer membrane protein assembly factor BamB